MERRQGDSDEMIKSTLDQDIAKYSASMVMVKVVCQLLPSNVNLGLLPSGSRVLSTSIRVRITTTEQKNAHQALFFDDHLKSSLCKNSLMINLKFKLTTVILAISAVLSNASVADDMDVKIT